MIHGAGHDGSSGGSNTGPLKSGIIEKTIGIIVLVDALFSRYDTTQ
jgi:hypothetical protein